LPDDFRTASRKSKERFALYIKPIVEKWLDAEIIGVEDVGETIAGLLDTNSGIDYIAKGKNGIRGIASRIQDDNEMGIRYSTFTIRERRMSGARTELAKLNDAVKNGSICAFWTVQGYVDKDGLHRVAMAKTTDVLEQAERHGKTRVTGEKQKGQAEFRAVEWSCFDDTQLYKWVRPSATITHSVMIWPELKKNITYSPLWPLEIYQKWVTTYSGTKEQQKRYEEAISWYQSQSIAVTQSGGYASQTRRPT